MESKENSANFGKIIIDAYYLYNSNAARAVREIRKAGYEVSYHKVYSTWIRNDLRPNGKIVGGAKLSRKEIENILEAHLKYKGNCALASRKLNLSPTTICKYWRIFGKTTLIKPRGGIRKITAVSLEKLLTFE